MDNLSYYLERSAVDFYVRMNEMNMNKSIDEIKHRQDKHQYDYYMKIKKHFSALFIITQTKSQFLLLNITKKKTHKARYIYQHSTTVTSTQFTYNII